MHTVDEPLGVADLQHLTFEEPPSGDLFNQPGESPTSARIMNGVVESGSIPGSPARYNPMRYRRALTHKITTLEEGGTRGLTVAAPVYALPSGAHISPSWTLDAAARYISEMGPVAAWVTLGCEGGRTWAAGIVDPSCGALLRSGLDDCYLQAAWRKDAKGRDVLAALYVAVPAWAHPRAVSLTKRQLLDDLTSGPLGNMPDDTPVIVDGGGSRLSPLASVERVRYVADTTWSGGLAESGEDGVAMDAILLGPVN